MKRIFGENGLLGDVLGSCEYRDEQLAMSEYISERLSEREHAFIEAGTGTGKTLAYLVPAVLYAIENEKKITLTTETRALQKQLFQKDLPAVQKLVREHFNADFSYSLCLGGSNYPCRKRFELALRRGRFSPEEIRVSGDIGRMFSAGIIFTRLDVTAPQRLWNEICRDGETCSSYRCAFASMCPYQMARKEWTRSTLLVMNHYLFFTNIAMERTYLPETEIVIFDEAHSLEEIASAQLGTTAGYDQLMEIMGLFYRPRKKNVLLSSIEKKKNRELAAEQAKEIISEASAFYEGLRPMIGKKTTLRVREPLGSGADLVNAIKNFLLLMRENEDDFSGEESLRMEFDIARGKLFLYLEALGAAVHHSRENHVYWLESDRAGLAGDITARSQPIDVAEIMAREVIDCHESCIFVSATLSVNGDFSYMAGRLGASGRFGSLSLGSSFDYRSQMLVYIGADMPAPESPEFPARAARAAAEIIGGLGGNCLLLFTSYKMLGEVKELLRRMVSIPIYSQDEMPPSQAVELYVKDGNSILMGTHSFWQGIDLPGDILRGVIMMRLPFAAPDSPPVEARMEKVEQSGKNSFGALQVPEAVIRFRQGVGRLIRSKKDRGVVAILDPRIVSKGYGRIFMRSLPPGCRVIHEMGELKKMIGEVAPGQCDPAE